MSVIKFQTRDENGHLLTKAERIAAYEKMEADIQEAIRYSGFRAQGRPKHDLTNRRFGALTAIRFLPPATTNSAGKPRSRRGYRWECRCDCGNIHVTDAYILLGGECCSCGCQWKERIGKKNSCYLTFNGERRSIKGWAEKLGISPNALSTRIKKKWSVERALTQPVRRRRKF